MSGKMNEIQDYFPVELLGEIFWYENLPLQQSAFVPYSYILEPQNPREANMNKKMIEFLKRSVPKVEFDGEERERCYRHMMNERMRKDKQKWSYLALHSMLPHGTKNDKNSIIQAATKTIQQFQEYREQLRMRNLELEKKLEEQKLDEGTRRIKLKVNNPAAGVDSMLAVLKRLKDSELNTRTIRSNFSAHEFSAELLIETRVGAGEVEKTMQRTLEEADRKIPSHLMETWKM